jgi:hypothetical protein
MTKSNFDNIVAHIEEHNDSLMLLSLISELLETNDFNALNSVSRQVNYALYRVFSRFCKNGELVTITNHGVHDHNELLEQFSPKYEEWLKSCSFRESRFEKEKFISELESFLSLASSSIQVEKPSGIILVEYHFNNRIESISSRLSIVTSDNVQRTIKQRSEHIEKRIVRYTSQGKEPMVERWKENLEWVKGLTPEKVAEDSWMFAGENVAFLEHDAIYRVWPPMSVNDVEKECACIVKEIIDIDRLRDIMKNVKEYAQLHFYGLSEEVNKNKLAR